MRPGKAEQAEPRLNDRLDRLRDYPFRRLAALLEGIAPPKTLPPVMMSIGDPQDPPPPELAAAIASQPADWGRYPPLVGTIQWQEAVTGWLHRRYGIDPVLVRQSEALLPLSGTREGLYLAAQLAVGGAVGGRLPLVLMPNPYYAVYEGAAVLSGAEPMFLPATVETGFLPDLGAIPAEALARTALFYLTSPANPQGVAADVAYLKDVIALARRHEFILAVDECYADVYDRSPPASVLEVAARMEGSGHPFRGILAFHSLSKRSSAAGLRSGFVCGDPFLIKAFARLRSYSHAGSPTPILAAAAALWSDDAHASRTRAIYRSRIDVAEAALGGRFGFYRPPGGFFLWLDVGDGEAACRKLWQQEGIKVLPGSYITGPSRDGRDIGQSHIRVALVEPTAVIADALQRMAHSLSELA